jgi:hypothetical protein
MITEDEVIEYLNTILKIDPILIQSLLDLRFRCNAELYNHPSLRVGCRDNECETTVFALINGLFGMRPDGFGKLSYIRDTKDGKILKFERML